MSLDSNDPVVLVVDDSPDSLGMINSALDQAGYTVLVALNGQQALEITRLIRPDVVLMDAVMPVMDGFECSRTMRRRMPLTPIIFMTGLSDAGHTLKAFEHGGSDYITKPINPAELLARIRVHVSNAAMISNARAALDEVRQHVLAVDRAGRLLWATPGTHDLLAAKGIDPEMVSPGFSGTLGSWLESGETGRDLVIATEGGPLTLRFLKSVHENEHLLLILGGPLLMDPELLQARLPVTRREAEVLLWVAHGKTNREIGEILSLSPRTVNKHLEQIYPKLQVDNRSSATAIAIQALLGLPV
ncbi:MAG TPA: response regulator transcription factor [Sedimenticola sp.]|nr:response regulator transcription factor [Sedimenticola sp.]